MNTQYKDIMVTVRCITFDHAPYIRQCLEGFVMQKTKFHFEVVVHDDASTDGTADIVREYAEKYPDIIIPIIEEENQYSKGNRSISRILLPYMKGKYVAYCEGDDYWTDPFKLQKQVDFLEKHPDYVFCYTNATVVDGNNRPILHNTERRYSGDVGKKLIIQGNFVIAAGTCFRNYWKEWEEERNAIPFGLKMVDKPMWLFYSSKGKFKYFRDKMVAYRVLKESASHSTNFEKILAFKDSGEQIALYFNKRYNIGVPERSINKVYAIGKARAAAKISRSVFVEYYLKMIKKYPEFIFNVKILTIAFIRVLLNKAI